jgi:hypothetical protein
MMKECRRHECKVHILDTDFVEESGPLHNMF